MTTLTTGYNVSRGGTTSHTDYRPCNTENTGFVAKMLCFKIFVSAKQDLCCKFLPLEERRTDISARSLAENLAQNLARRDDNGPHMLFSAWVGAKCKVLQNK